MRRAGRVLAWAAAVAVSVAALMLVVPIVRGEPSRLVIVSGHSMDPTLHTGDLVLAWPRADYRVGDLTPYRVPAGQPGEGGMVIHRIVGGSADDGFVMQGDNNPAPDIWMPRHDDIVGREVLVVPMLGELMAWIRQPAVVAALAAGAVAAVVVHDQLGRLRRT
jgi:signal peptidase